MKISVIIPIYNISEAYLRECLNSVTSQTFPYAEYLLVIDGATDSSPEICREYADCDPRFKLFIRQNSGAGATRNFGLDKATGDYVMFMDSDDYWLDVNLISNIAELLSESHADVLSFSYKEFYDENRKPQKATKDNVPRSAIINRTDAVKRLLRASRSTFSSSIITKVIKLSFIRDNNIRFLEGLNGEDAHFTAQLIYCAKTYDRLNWHVYAVRRHRQSTSRNVSNNEHVIRSMLIIFDDLFNRYHLSDTDDSPVLDFLASPYLYVLGKIAAMNDPKLYLKQMQKYDFILTHSSRAYVCFVGILIHITSLNFVMKVLRIFLLINHKSIVSIDTSKKGRN